MPSDAWDRRNANARAKGYTSYYDYRIHNYGRIPAGTPAPGGIARARLRGHTSLADLERAIRGAQSVLPTGSGRDSKGRYTRVDVAVIYPNGKVRYFVLRGRAASTYNLRRLRQRLVDSSIPYMEDPSFDVFQQK